MITLSSEQIFVLIIAGAALLLILTNRLRSDLVALLVMLALSFSGIITIQQAFGGFSQSAVITIISLFIITHALEETGVISWIANRLKQFGGGQENRMIGLVMGTGAGLALFMNIIAAGAVLLPAVIGVARESRLRPSKLLIPLSYGTLIGATATYFATANIVMSTILIQQGEPPLNIIDFLPTGIPIICAGLLFMIFIGWRLLPDRVSHVQRETAATLSRSLAEAYQLDERLWEVKVLPTSQLVNVPLSESNIGEELGLTVLSIWRGHDALLTPSPHEVIHAGDMLLITGRQDRVSQLLSWGVILGRNGDNKLSHQYNVDLTEVLIPPRSHIIGKTLQELRFRDRFGLTSVALWRNGRSYRTDVGKFKLEEGDALLMVGSPRKIETLAHDADYMVLESSHARRPRHPEKAIIALILFAAAIILSILEIAPTAQLMLAAAVGMILTGCLSADEAYRAVEWRVVFLIAGMLSLTAAMTNTGLDALIGGILTDTFAPFGDLFFVAAIFLMTMFVTQITTGQVASLVMGPIVIAAALQVGINSHAVAVAAATACAAAFMTPVAHPVNALIMGPGGYKPTDFLRIGIPMTALVFGALLFGMIVFWGIR